MARFPNQLVSNPNFIRKDISERGDKALAHLREKGFVLAAGLTEYYAGAISIMGEQKSIREYCPKDATPKRFANLPSTKQWLQKGGGRAMFLLLEEQSERLAGYGWTGVEPCEELPEHPITSAYRLSETHQGKRLSGDFVVAVAEATRTLYLDDEGIGLETWRSNGAARLYPNVGFDIRHTGDWEERPTLDVKNHPTGLVFDKRQYMAYDPDFLLPAA